MFFVTPKKQKHLLFYEIVSKSNLETTKDSYFYGNYGDRAFILKYQSRDHDVPDETPKKQNIRKKFLTDFNGFI